MKIHCKCVFLCSGFYEAFLDLQSPGCSRDEHPEPRPLIGLCRRDVDGQVSDPRAGLSRCCYQVVRTPVPAVRDANPQGLLLVSQNLSWEAALLV